MQEKTKAYAAGMMDAEGCFSIYLSQTSGRNHYQPRIVLSNVNLPLIKDMIRDFGGFYTAAKPKRGQTWYQWNNNKGASARSFLDFTIPYLRQKKDEAQILREFYQLGSVENPSKRHELMSYIRALKNRSCVTTDTLDGDSSDKLTHAYTAAILDGEGCISSAILNSGKSFVRVRMSNSYFPLIDLFRRLYGGWHHTKSAVGKSKEFFTWEITAKEQKENFLLQTLPYLRIKRQQAINALQYVRLGENASRETRHILCNRISRLNQLPKIQSELTGDRKSVTAETQIT